MDSDVSLEVPSLLELPHASRERAIERHELAPGSVRLNIAIIKLNPVLQDEHHYTLLQRVAHRR